jgi:hypothetical protein
MNDIVEFASAKASRMAESDATPHWNCHGWHAESDSESMTAPLEDVRQSGRRVRLARCHAAFRFVVRNNNRGAVSLFDNGYGYRAESTTLHILQIHLTIPIFFMTITFS